MTQRRPRDAVPLRPFVVALAMIVALIIVTYFAFHPRLPFVDGYRVEVGLPELERPAQGLAGSYRGRRRRQGRRDQQGAGHHDGREMEIKDRGRPLHRDAVAASAPECSSRAASWSSCGRAARARRSCSGGTIPLPQTTMPVQFHQVLAVFDAPAREQMRRTMDASAAGLSSGGAEGLKTLAPELRPLLHDLAWVGEAARGTAPHDLSRMIESTTGSPRRWIRTRSGLATRRSSSRDRRRGPVARRRAGGRDRRAGRRAARDAGRRARSGCGAAGSRIREPEVDAGTGGRAARFRESTSTLREHDRLVEPSARERTIGAMRTTLIDMPSLISGLAELLPAVKPMTERQASADAVLVTNP